jgi:hypothetical protein
MTQRQAVFVGCRLIAVYLVAEAAIVVGSSLFSLGMMTNMMAGPGGRMMPAPSPFEPMLKSMAMQAIVRGGVAILLWSAAAKISRGAANAEDGDDGWHGE